MYTLYLNGQMTTFIGFTDGTNRYTLNLASAASIFYSPSGDLVSLGGVCLGPSTNNTAKYHVVIGLLLEALDSDVREIRVCLDSELVVQYLNQVYIL